MSRPLAPSLMGEGVLYLSLASKFTASRERREQGRERGSAASWVCAVEYRTRTMAAAERGESQPARHLTLDF